MLKIEEYSNKISEAFFYKLCYFVISISWTFLAGATVYLLRSLHFVEICISILNSRRYHKCDFDDVFLV